MNRQWLIFSVVFYLVSSFDRVFSFDVFEGKQFMTRVEDIFNLIPKVDPSLRDSFSPYQKQQENALHSLANEGWSLVEVGFYASLVNVPGEQVAGNPNTLYSFVAWNNSEKLIPYDYPFALPPKPVNETTKSYYKADRSSTLYPTFTDLYTRKQKQLKEYMNPTNMINQDPKPPGIGGFAIDADEAIVWLYKLPPKCKYFGITSYVTNRLLINDTYGDPNTFDCEGNIIQHTSIAEISNPLNYLIINTTSNIYHSKANIHEDKENEIWNKHALMVFAPSLAVFNRISEAFSTAGFPKEAHNFYEYSGQLLRLHQRGSSTYTNYPDLNVILSRSSYFDSEKEKSSYGSKVQPVFFIKAPPLSSKANKNTKFRNNLLEYRKTVPMTRLRNDKIGESEDYLLPSLQKLCDLIISNKTSSGLATLVRKEQLQAVPNDRQAQSQCLNNETYVAAVDPFMNANMGGCGFGTRDCRYGTSKNLDDYFGDDIFFVLVGIQHEKLEHSSYSSIMLTSKAHYEQGNHTITVRESNGVGAPFYYGMDKEDPNANLIYAFSFARDCGRDPYCESFNSDQFKANDVVYWMERAYVQKKTKIAPNIDEYVMSYILTFRGTNS